MKLHYLSVILGLAIADIQDFNIGRTTSRSYKPSTYKPSSHSKVSSNDSGEFYLSGRYQRITGDAFDGEFDIAMFGLGKVFEINDKWEVLAEGHYGNTLSTPADNLELNVINASCYGKVAFGSRLYGLVGAYIAYQDESNTGSFFSYSAKSISLSGSVGLGCELNDQLAADFRLTPAQIFEEDATSMSFGVRFTF